MNKPIVKVFLCIFVLFVLFGALTFVTNIRTPRLEPVKGTIHVSDSAQSWLGQIETDGWEYYPERFYSAADFENGSPITPQYTGDAELANYGTFRLILHLTPGQTYAMTGHSFNFSQRVMIDGEYVDQVGTPGTSKDTTTPYSRTYIYLFTATDETTEIIFQAASFHHRLGAGNASIIMGDFASVNRWSTIEAIRTLIVVGSLLTVFIYYMSMFIIFNKRTAFLYVAFSALMMALRILIVGEKYLMELFPMLSWFVAIRLEYIFNCLFVIFLLMYFQSLFSNLINKYIIRGITGMLVIYILIIIFFDTLTSTKLIAIFPTLWISASVITLWAIAKRLKKRDPHTLLVFIGFIVFALTAGFDEVMYLIRHERTYLTITMGTFICILMNMLALTLNFSDTEATLNKTRQQQQKLDEENALLNVVNRTKTQFMENISHEMKTPLTVMSSHAQLSKTLLSKEVNAADITPYLDTIAREAERLSRLMGNVMEMTIGQDSPTDMTVISPEPFLSTCATIFKPMLNERENTITLDISKNLPDIYGNPDALSQVIINLLSNANRHTYQGEITLSANRDGKHLSIIVKDTGEGIDAAILPHVMERHIQSGTKGSRGLGLSICQNILSLHGGTMTIESSESNGTTVYVTIPICNKEHTHDENNSSY